MCAYQQIIGSLSKKEGSKKKGKPKDIVKKKMHAHNDVIAFPVYVYMHKCAFI